MKFEDMKKQFVGKKLLTIIRLDSNNEEVRKTIRKITNISDSYGIDDVKLLLFENNKALIFIDFDCDGYRSGDWNLAYLEEVLDKGRTKEIKHINSIVKDIERFEGRKIRSEYSDDEGVLITTEEYVIAMGQDNSDSYYPSNFFSVDECKEFALGKNAVLIDLSDDVNGRVTE